MSNLILVVDDDATLRRLLRVELSARGFHVADAASVKEARRKITEQEVAVGLFDLRLPDGSGLDLLRIVQEEQPSTEVVVLTGHGTIDTAIEAMRLGAFDYIRKPCSTDELEVTLNRALERRGLVARNAILTDGFAPPSVEGEVIGVSEAFRNLKSVVDRVAVTDASVLVTGETGVGKDVIARLLHNRSRRARQPFVVVCCAALQEELLHSELFGHVRGAYTGAVQHKHGLFEVADGGTLFLDEIGDVSLATQVKLLRVLETGRFRQVGGTKEIQVDVRIVAATNRNLEELMKKGFFRTDLYYRLSTVRMEVPPLRDRREDVLVLAQHFLDRCNVRYGRATRFSPQVKQALATYAWPGNVRELLHAVERAVILADEGTIGVEHLPPEIRSMRPGTPSRFRPLREVEEEYILEVLAAMGGNRQSTAAVLGISERTLYRKLKEA